MKGYIISTIVFVFILTNAVAGYAQSFSRGEQTVIQPMQVLMENYTIISLRIENEHAADGNRFDRTNPYTYLQLLYDESGKGYQIIFQVSFSGKILLLAYSNNLSALFNKMDKPLNIFSNCIRTVNSHVSPVQNIDAAILCIIDRLNYCSY